MEKVIAKIWQMVLGVERVGVNDNFFDLGGHSLLMTEIYSQLQKVIDKDLRMAELFQYPNIQSLARFLAPDKEALSVPQGAKLGEKVKTGQSRLQQQFALRRLAPKRK